MAILDAYGRTIKAVRPTKPKPGLRSITIEDQESFDDDDNKTTTPCLVFSFTKDFLTDLSHYIDYPEEAFPMLIGYDEKLFDQTDADIIMGIDGAVDTVIATLIRQGGSPAAYMIRNYDFSNARTDELTKRLLVSVKKKIH